MHYLTAGEPSAPAIVLLHQAWSSSAMWLPAMLPLARSGWHVLAPDLLGHGATDDVAHRPALTDFATGVWELLDALGIQSARLAGYSSGVTLAALMAIDRPARVTDLVLASVPLMNGKLFPALRDEQPFDWASAGEWLARRWQAKQTMGAGNWTPEAGRLGLITLAQNKRSNIFHNAIAETPIDDLLPRVPQPVLIVCGERDNLFEESREAAALAPRCRFQPVPGATFDMAFSTPEAFAKLFASQV